MPTPQVLPLTPEALEAEIQAAALVHRVIHMIQKERRVNADANNLVTPAKAGAHS